MRLSPTDIREHWSKYFAEGVLLVALGIVALVLPEITEAGRAIILGTVILTGALGGLLATFHTWGAPGTRVSLGSSGLGILVGTLLLLRPALGTESLTLILATYLMVEGMLSTRFAIEHRRGLSGRWHWMLASGAMDFMLGLVFLLCLQVIAEWALNSAIALDLIVGGWALLGMALAARTI
jgi:uncharacterized membrane protein HdeD (DUF308 family)